MDSDENTQMMIQLASMMMQNQNAMKEAQSQLEAAGRDIKSETFDDVTGDVTKSKPSKKDKSDVAEDLTTNGNQAFDMDPKLMAEFARQIVMNANSGTSGSDTPKRSSADKPATIAQIIQSQQNGESTTANSSEGKIFVYNQLPDENGSQGIADVKPDINALAALSTVHSTSSNGSFPLPGNTRRSPSIGPIRNRYGRVLRPGIDNFGRFEAVANPGLIMHAMELLRQKDKKKRGPKEKETFSVFMYCLPDKNSKLPKFSSLDPVERALVEQHQQEGYGYPSVDYINGIPRKTQLCLSFDEKKFQGHMTSLYPKLDGRMYGMYRIDKTRRLIRVDARSPRQLKDMKYQGSLIVIPYDKADDQPAAVIHRNFDDVYTNNNNNNNNSNSNWSLGNPLSMIQNFNIPLPSLAETIADSSQFSTTKGELPVFPGQREVQKPDKTEKPIGNGKHNLKEEMDVDADDCQDFLENVKILKKASLMRKRLKNTKKIYIRHNSILTDMLDSYRENSSLHQHKLSIFLRSNDFPDNSDSQTDTITTGAMFVMFWEEVFKKYFTGNHQVVPVVDPNMPEDLFVLCGRILVHGLVLENYFPVRLSEAFFTMLLTNSCSEKMVLDSFYQLLSDTEKDIFEDIKAEIKNGAERFSTNIKRSIKIILGSYSCRSLPEPYDFDTALINISRSYILFQPYWCLCQMRDGIEQTSLDLEDISEDDVVEMYKSLTPSVPKLIQRLYYVTSGEDETAVQSEQNVMTFFEQYLHKMSKSDFLKLLQQWCNFDCLCVPKLNVCFSDEEQCVEFNAKEATLVLPSSCTSYEEFSQVLNYNIPADIIPNKNNWEYSL
ncbi:hypothetical protein ACF0H5_008551 [Mactra antiquata]